MSRSTSQYVALAALAAGIVGAAVSAEATVVVADTFTLSDTRVVGDNLQWLGSDVSPKVTEIGGLPWFHSGGDTFAFQFATSGDGGKVVANSATTQTYSAMVDLANNGITGTAYTVSADIDPTGSAWSSLQFNDDGNSIWNASILMLLQPNGGWAIYGNHIGISVGGGTATSYAPGAMNKLTLAYDTVTNKLNAWVNTEQVVTGYDFGGYHPGINYAAVTALDVASVSGVSLDNFSLDVAPVPEPAGLAVLGLGAALMTRRTRKENSRA